MYMPHHKYHVPDETTNQENRVEQTTLHSKQPRIICPTSGGVRSPLDKSSSEYVSITDHITYLYTLRQEIQNWSSQTNGVQKDRRSLSAQERHEVFHDLYTFRTQFVGDSLQKNNSYPLDNTTQQIQNNNNDINRGNIPYMFQLCRLWSRLAIDVFGNVILRSAHPLYRSPLRWHVDHMVPFVWGGTCSGTNFVGMQADANQHKGTRTMPECLHSPLWNSYWHRPSGYYADCCHHLSLTSGQKYNLKHACQSFPPTTWTFGFPASLFWGLMYFVDHFVQPFNCFEQQLLYQCLLTFFFVGTTSTQYPWRTWMWYFTLLYVPEQNSVQSCHGCLPSGNLEQVLLQVSKKTCVGLPKCDWLRMHVELLYHFITNNHILHPSSSIWSLQLFQALENLYRNTPMQSTNSTLYTPSQQQRETQHIVRLLVTDHPSWPILKSSFKQTIHNNKNNNMQDDNSMSWVTMSHVEWRTNAQLLVWCTPSLPSHQRPKRSYYTIKCIHAVAFVSKEDLEQVLAINQHTTTIVDRSAERSETTVQETPKPKHENRLRAYRCIFRILQIIWVWLILRVCTPITWLTKTLFVKNFQDAINHQHEFFRQQIVHGVGLVLFVMIFFYGLHIGCRFFNRRRF